MYRTIFETSRKVCLNSNSSGQFCWLPVMNKCEVILSGELITAHVSGREILEEKTDYCLYKSQDCLCLTLNLHINIHIPIVNIHILDSLKLGIQHSASTRQDQAIKHGKPKRYTQIVYLIPVRLIKNRPL